MPDGMDVRFPKRLLGCTIGGIGVEKLGPGVRIPFGHAHTQIPFGVPLGEENDGNLVAGWWTD